MWRERLVQIALDRGEALRGIDGLGRGDAKLLAAGGAWCGWIGLPFIVLIASLGGIIQGLISGAFRGEARRPIPFGPALSLAIFLVWIYSRFNIAIF